MAFYLGNHGNIRLRRGTDNPIGRISARVGTDDISTVLHRVGIDDAIDNLFTGDRVDIETADSRGVDFIPASNWSSGATEDTFSAFVNVNAAGGLRLFSTFEDAINNTRANEIDLETFTGDPIDVTITVRDVKYNTLGNVSRYEFNTLLGSR